MYLLDTHALVWRITVPEQLPARVSDILAEKEVSASVVSYWELILKKARRTALVVEPKAWWDRYITRPAVEVLPVRVPHVVAQALAENYTLVSRDGLLSRYGAKVVWE
jgi:PIN domain nuclease of toxin-antitoxin system